MGIGVQKSYSVTMASAGTLTSELNLGRSYQNMYLSVPSMTSNSQLHVQVADVAGGTYRRVTQPVFNSTTAGAPADFTVVSSVTNRVVPLPAGFQFMKLETTATVDSGQTFKVICGD